MSKWKWLLTTIALLALTAIGCGGLGERGVNKNKDRPKSDTRP